jgi:hypothetical protein
VTASFDLDESKKMLPHPKSSFLENTLFRNTPHNVISPRPKNCRPFATKQTTLLDSLASSYVNYVLFLRATGDLTCLQESA